jgi:hypothetical protein
LRFDDPADGRTEWKAIRVDRQQMLLFNLSRDVSESVDMAASHAAVVAHIAGIMEREHVESEQWPSTRSPADRCCAGCFSAHGCVDNKTGHQCPPPNKTAAAEWRLPNSNRPPVLTLSDVVGVFWQVAGDSRSASLVIGGDDKSVRISEKKQPPAAAVSMACQLPAVLPSGSVQILCNSSGSSSSGMNSTQHVQPAGTAPPPAVRGHLHGSELSVQASVERAITTVDVDYRYVSWRIELPWSQFTSECRRF